MENDFRRFSKEASETMDELGIAFQWRDSCVDILVELRKCMKNDYLSSYPVLNYFSVCKGIQDLWKKCEKDRELKLLDKYFSMYKTIENDLKKRKDSSNV